MKLKERYDEYRQDADEHNERVAERLRDEMAELDAQVAQSLRDDSDRWKRRTDWTLIVLWFLAAMSAGTLIGRIIAQLFFT